MKSLFATLTTLCALLCCGGENLLSTPLADWQRDFRPAESKQIYDLKILEDRTRIRRFANSTFGRIYHDLKLEPGATYRLTYDQTTPHGALVKMLVIFRGEDGKWREKTRLSNYEPLVNGEWSTGTMVFRMPDDAREARIDFRIDSFGTVDLRNVSLVKLPESEAAAYWKKPKFPPSPPETAATTPWNRTGTTGSPSTRSIPKKPRKNLNGVSRRRRGIHLPRRNQLLRPGGRKEVIPRSDRHG